MDESKPDKSLDKETHGSPDDIDVNTPISDVKGPNVLERVKEEFEAIVEAMNARKEDKNLDSPSSAQRDEATFTGLKHENQSLAADKGVKEPNVLGNGKEETKALLDTEKQPTHNKETQLLRDDIDVNTPISDIKGPNVFERVKDELEAIVETIRPRKDDKNSDSPSSAKRGDATFTGSKYEKQSSPAEDYMSSPSKFKQTKIKVKEETPKKKSSSVRHKETHGKGEDIDVDTPISEFKGPSIFHRAKEEIEAIVDTIQSKKESDQDTASPKKEGGFRATIGQKLNTIYTKNKNRD